MQLLTRLFSATQLSLHSGDSGPSTVLVVRCPLYTASPPSAHPSLQPIRPPQRSHNLLEKHLRHERGHRIPNLLPDFASPHIRKLMFKWKALQAGHLAQRESAATTGMVALPLGACDCAAQGCVGVVGGVVVLRDAHWIVEGYTWWH